MNQITFQREITMNAPLAHVWQLVATEDGLRQWWGNPIALEPTEGGRCEEWRLDRDKPAHWLGKVTLYAPPHQITLTLQAQDPAQPWPEITTISIALEAKGEETAVYVTHRALAPAMEDRTDRRQSVLHPARYSPTAQLGGNASTRMPSYSSAQLTHTRWTPQQSDPWVQCWQARLTMLAALGIANIQKIAA
jgi:uncharacterized protein YndB with AHSA1/START domain